MRYSFANIYEVFLPGVGLIVKWQNNGRVGIVDLCDKSEAMIKPIIMQYHEIYQFEDCHRNKKSNLPRLHSIPVAEFQKGSCAI